MSFRLSRAGTPRPVSFYLLTFGVSFIAALPAAAQQPLPDSTYPSPRLLSVSPCGAKAGTVVDVTFAGTDLDEPEKLLFSLPGFKAEQVEAPPDPKEAKPAEPRGNRRRNKAAPPTTFAYKVTVPPDAPLGIADVRIAGKWGVSNARAFVIGDLPEIAEKEPNNDLPQAQRVELNTTINGNMASAVDVDYFVFSGKKGQRVLLSCLASSIDSRFLPGIELYDAKSRLLATGRNYFDNDALADCTLPDDGDYTVRLFEFTHTADFRPGPNEYFYRLTITTAPWIDAVFPPLFEPGKPTPATIYGRNLPGGQLDPSVVVDGRVLEKLTTTITAPAADAAHRLNYNGWLSPVASGLDGFEYRVKNGVGALNPFLLTLAHNPVVLHNDANNTFATAQDVTPPCEIAGRFEKLHDRDWYSFNAKKGEVYNLEVRSDRIGAPTLTFLVVHDAAQKLIYESPEGNDNFKDSFSNKFFTHSEDPPPYRFTAPADGKYFVQVGGHLADALAGPRHFYTLRIAPDQPDYQLVVTANANERPDACTLLQGGNQSYTVYAWRQDNFAGDIALSVEGLPAGVTCPPQTIGGGVHEAQLVLSAAAGAAAWTGEIKVKGTATIKGQPVVREARAGGVIWPPPQPNQNMPLAGRVERSVPLAVRADKAPYSVTAAIDNAVLTQSEPNKKQTTATITVKQTRDWPDLKQPIAVQVLQPELPGKQNQQGSQIVVNNNQPMNLAPGQADAKLPVTIGANVQPGVYNIVLYTSATNVPFVRDPNATPKPPAVNITLVEPSTPLTVTVLPRVLGTLTLATQNPTLKAGGDVALVVKVARLYDYAGEFKVTLVPPANVKDVTAEEVVIPAGKDETTLTLKAPATAAPGGRNELVVRAVALYEGKTPTTQEVKFNLNVAKSK